LPKGHEVKELLGHSTVQITEKHYAYLAPKNLRSAIAKLENLVMKSVIKKFGKKPGEIHNFNGILVPKEGLEPSCPQGARDFESRASANSATSAHLLSRPQMVIHTPTASQSNEPLDNRMTRISRIHLPPSSP
jgi:hypothetical protein